MDAALRDTPALTVDLDAVERNIRRLQEHCDREGLANRPHIKTHKLPGVAHMQLAAGAVGIACQKLGEAEVMAASGISDILLTFPIVGEEKLARLVRLAASTRLGLVGDSAVVARGVSVALAREGLECDFVVECDTGLGRTGVQSPEEAAGLAALVASLPGLRFAGLMTYPTPRDGGAWLRAAREECEAAGLALERVSGGGTPHALDTTREKDALTEVRAGTYVYGDRHCLGNGTVRLEDVAQVVRATVVSRPTRDRAIVDAGTKALTSDPVAQSDAGGHGFVREFPEAVVYRLNEEHGYLDVSRCPEAPEVGQVVSIVPNHACGATNLYDEVVVTRSGRVVGIWPVLARGRNR